MIELSELALALFLAAAFFFGMTIRGVLYTHIGEFARARETLEKAKRLLVEVERLHKKLTQGDEA